MASLQSGNLSVRQASGPDELLQHADAWRRLLRDTPRSSLFHSPEWLSLWWRHFGSEQQPQILLVFDGEQLVGVLPLSIKVTATRIGPVRVLSYPLDSWGTTYGPLGVDPQRIATAALSHLRARPRLWDVFELNWTPDELRGPMQAAMQAVGLSVQTTAATELSLIDFEGTWENYWAAKSSKVRSNIRRSEKQLGRLGRIEFVHYRPSDSPERDPRWDLYAMCEQVAQRSWQGTSTDGNTLTHNRVREFLRAVHAVAAERNRVSLHLLLVNSTPVAFLYNYVDAGRVFGLRQGFDSRFAGAGPGAVLLSRMIEDCFGRGDQSLDLGEGSAPYKQLWRTRTEPSFRCCSYSGRSPRGQLLRAKRWLSGWGHGNKTTNDSPDSSNAL